MKGLIKKIIPGSVFRAIQPAYHYSLALLGALIYHFPSRYIHVVAVTGTKGKTTTAEIVNAFLEEAGYKTALAGTLRIKIGESSRPNLLKMTMPGRFFLNKFLREAAKADCQYAVIEMTSEGAKQFRNKFIALNALIFTNLAPEHIESHGSYEKYRDAKLSIAKGLERSPKRPRIIVSNIDDKEGQKFLAIKAEKCLPYSLKNTTPHLATPEGVSLNFKGNQLQSSLPGIFNVYNILGAATYAETQGVTAEEMQKALNNLEKVRGRMERIEEGQNFTVIVDYAHTPDSLEQVYKTFDGVRKVCVLGNCGGGRDKWKRPEMAKIADTYCDHIILTNEDPYDEDPRAIVDEMAVAIKNKPLEIIMDRREAIRFALEKAVPDSAVLITGKGTDPYIMGPNGTKIPWDDARVAREELDYLKINKLD